MTAPTIEVALAGRRGGFALEASFTAPGQGVTAVFGPSGCGKTTVLRCIAGLERLEGTCRVTGETWQDETTFRPPHRRPVGYVFQEASLFAHLSVEGNLLYGVRGRVPADAAVRFDDVVELLGLSPLLMRAPHNLSGGERQRVAIGRALLSQPRLLLMDEPLSALDRATKDEILPFLERLHLSLSLPVLYVTHDMREVERLADHLVLMRAGRVIAAGPLAALQSDPALPLVTARDAAVGLDAVVTHLDPAYGLATLAVDGGVFIVPAGAGTMVGERRRLRIAAGDVSLAREPPGPSTILNVLEARIRAVEAGDNEVTAVLGLGHDGAGARILARITRRSFERLELSEGMAVHAQIKSVALAPGVRR
ncbi:molybdate transport system ATP-binding protein [Chelatococcus caeni]|uniref:Molybdate transport system ATP-binding protein n=1 Tax=Chelatococcus caeni TaxID=1348468 RepID=A0A840C627_9HYPH|nr:molybdenum ABC transporter ATP-binding protein [Chelatococcus caeni]MBB4019058.1 molybdate transport system ATP-binding protein [Chelatococcus caeni]